MRDINNPQDLDLPGGEGIPFVKTRDDALSPIWIKELEFILPI